MASPRIDTSALPVVSADGIVSNTSLDEHANAQIKGVRHGGNAFLYHLPAASVLAACTPLPQRLLLRHGVQSRSDRNASALAQGFVYGVIAFLPAMLLAMLLKSMFDSKIVTAVAGLGVLLAAGLRGFWTEYRAPGGVWEHTQWLDFTDRSWKARKNYPDGSLPLETLSLPLDSLALLCYATHWEDVVTYDVGLCELTHLHKPKPSGPPTLDDVHWSYSQADALAFARTLSVIWDLECWQQIDGMQTQLVKLDNKD